MTSLAARPGEIAMIRFYRSTLGLAFLVICTHSAGDRYSYAYSQEYGPPLPGTRPLTMAGDIASDMVAGVDRFLLKQIDLATANREKHWRRDFSSLKAYEASVEPNRKRLAHILGCAIARRRPEQAEFIDGHGDPSTAGSRGLTVSRAYAGRRLVT